MATIPLGNFGYKIAQPQESVRAPAAAFEDGTAGLQSLGEAAMGVGVQLKRVEDQQNQALMRTKAANLLLDRETAITDIRAGLELDVKEGRVPYAEAKAEYTRRTQELQAPDVSGFDPVTAENLSLGIKRSDLASERFLNTLYQQGRTADMQTTAAGAIDRIRKQAGRSGADMNAITSQLDGMDEIGVSAYGQARWEKLKQDAKDGSWEDNIRARGRQLRDDPKALGQLINEINNGKLGANLDSDRRDAVALRLEGWQTAALQRQEITASRAQREQERYLANAERAAKSVVDLSERGLKLDPEFFDQQFALVRGTPYEAVVMQAAKAAATTGGFATKPISEQQKTIDTLKRKAAETGINPQIDAELSAYQKALDASKRDLKNDGIRAWVNRSPDSVSPVDTSSPDAFVKSLASRIPVAQRASAWSGETVSPLDPDEADRAGSMLSKLPPELKADAVAGITKTVGPAYAVALAKQIDKTNDALAMAFASGSSMTTAGRRVSNLILSGANALKDGTVLKDDKKVTGVKATIATQLEGAFPDETSREYAAKSAYFIAAGLGKDNGGTISTSDINRAVRLAVGGSIIDRQNKKLPIPAGYDKDTFEMKLRDLPPDAITKQAPDGKVIAGGQEMPAADFAKAIPGQELSFAGYGTYFVMVGGRRVINSSGKPIRVEVR